MRMRAAVLHQQGRVPPFVASKPYVFEDIDLDGPAEGEVLVEIKAAGLCHSDLSAVKGRTKRHVPYVGGHEGAGVVAEIGRGVAGLAQGDHVVMTAGSGCGHCRTCHSGRPVLCEQIRVARTQGVMPNGKMRLSRNGKGIFHYSGVSSFAEYAITTPSNLIKVDKSYPLDIAAMFGCAVMTGAGAIFNSARLRPGQSVVVIGLGGVGLNAVMAAKVAGASKIIGIDINTAKLPLARELGCTEVFLADGADLATAIRDLTDGGVDFVVEVSGSKAAMDLAFKSTRLGGEIVCIGVANAGAMFEYSLNEIVNDEKVIRGTHFGSGRPHFDIPRYLELFATGMMPVDRIRSDVCALDDLNQALDRLNDGAAIRQILTPRAAT